MECVITQSILLLSETHTANLWRIKDSGYPPPGKDPGYGSLGRNIFKHRVSFLLVNGKGTKEVSLEEKGQ